MLGTRPRAMLGRRACVLAAVVLACGWTLVPGVAAADAASFVVTPSPVTAGSDVTMSGSCTAEHPYGSVTVNPSPSTRSIRNDGTFYAQISLQMNEDHSFSTTVPVPREASSGTWIFLLNCFVPYGSGEFVTSSVEVVATTPAPLTFVQSPDPVVAGDDLTLTGQGCAVNGDPLHYLEVVGGHPVGSPQFGGDFIGQSGVQPGSDGQWQVTLNVPPGFSGGTATVDMTCTTFDSAPIQWWRHQTSLPVHVSAPPKPALVRNGEWYLRRSTTDGPADRGLEFTFGNPGDTALFGDWDGDGSDTA